MVYKFFDETISVSGIKHENIPNKKLAEELHKRIINNLNKRKVYLPFIDNIWGEDLADIQLIITFNKRFRSLFCVIDIYSTYTFVIPLEDKKDITITNVFQKALKESNRKPYKIW